MNQESEQDRLDRECHEMFAALSADGSIVGTYAEWLEAAAREAAAKLEPPAVSPIVDSVGRAFVQ